MDLYILNRAFEIVDIIDTASSVIWTEKYIGAGDFEIYMPASEKAVNVLRDDYYISRADTDRVMIIKNTTIRTDTENGNYLTVTGPSLESILNRRIIWQQTNLSGKVELAVRRLITENIMDPSVPERKIPNFKLGDIQGFAETMEMQVTGDNLGEIIDRICKTYNMGYKVTLQDGNFVFDMYRGTDRSYNQSANPYVVFSPGFENLLNSDYAYTGNTYKNVVLVAGEGEGLERKTKAVGDASGLNRYEMYADARNSSTNNGEISDTEYYANLAEDGKETLKENQATESFSGEVNYTEPYLYGRDYFLGDVVQVVNEYGITATPTITETIEADDENGYSLIPTFEYAGGAE